MAKAREAYSTKERAELLLQNLQKLRDEVSAVETQYDVLEADYTEICDDAISKISTLKTASAHALESSSEESEVFKSEMTNLDARFKLGLVPVESYLEQKEALAEAGALPPGQLQSIVDKAADCIEFGLDKIGDGIIFPAETMVNICSAVFKTLGGRARKPDHL
jgi:hypothetical protein